MLIMRAFPTVPTAARFVRLEDNIYNLRRCGILNLNICDLTCVVIKWETMSLILQCIAKFNPSSIEERQGMGSTERTI